MPTDRRTFLRHAVAGALAAGSFALPGTAATPQSQPNSLPQGPIVDTHQHLWDLQVVHLRWVQSCERLNRSFVSNDYREATRGLNVAQAVYMEVAADTEELEAEARYVVDLCQRSETPTTAAVLGGRPGEPSFAPYLRRWAQNQSVKGVRWILSVAALEKQIHLSQPFTDDLRLLGQLGLCFDLCLPAERLAEAKKVVASAPETRYVLDHCGNPNPAWFRPPVEQEAIDRWRRDLAELASCQQVVCKISGLVSRVWPGWAPDDLAPMVEHCLDSFGPDRVMFAGDWPVCLRAATFLEWVAALQAIVSARPTEQQRKLWHDNAVRFYGLKA